MHRNHVANRKKNKTNPKKQTNKKKRNTLLPEVLLLRYVSCACGKSNGLSEISETASKAPDVHYHLTST